MLRIVFVVALLHVGMAWGLGLTGAQKYSPTALEWLRIYCDSLTTKKEGFFVTCDVEGPNSIKLRIRYWDREKKEEADQEFTAINFHLTEYAKDHGWSWLEVTKEVTFIDVGVKPSYSSQNIW